jgi:hypothetical protein
MECKSLISPRIVTPPFRGPLFVVGMPRSGTKLLRDLLNGHSQIGIPAAETEFLPDWCRRWPEFGDLSDRATFQRFYDRMQKSAYFVYLREEQRYETDPQRWYEACAGWGVAEVFEALIREDAHCPLGSTRIWGDKSPSYIAQVPLLDRLWPSARVVHIVRDVRDYALSIHHAWGKDMLRAAQRWVDRVEQVAQEGAALGPHRFQELRYEDLLTDPAVALDKLSGFLDIPFEPSMTKLQRASENKGDAKGEIGIKADNSGKFGARMEPGLRRAIEAIAAPTLARYGYEGVPSTPASRVPAWRMMAGQAADGAALVRSEADERGWLGALRFRWSVFAETGAWERLR